MTKIQFAYPLVFILILAVAIFLIFILNKRFVEFKEEKEFQRKKKFFKAIFFISRILIAALILAIIAEPFFLSEKEILSKVVLKLIVDNSSSMEILEKVNQSFIENLKSRIDVEIAGAGINEKSFAGDAALRALRPYSSILLITDGNVNEGLDLGDVALQASKINSSINFLFLKNEKADASIVIEGPSKVLESVETEFLIKVFKVNLSEVPIKVFLDGKEIFSGSIKEEKKIVHSFGAGEHELIAKIELADYFQSNNIFYKSIKAVPKPKIAFFGSGEAPLLDLLKKIYDIEVVDSFPKNLEKYYGLIIDNTHAEKLNAHTERLADWISNGEGVLVIGGDNAFDEGRYRNSLFESILPVKVGKPIKRPGDTAIVILLDVSGSTSARWGEETTVDVGKALALDIIKNLRRDVFLALIAFSHQQAIISPLVKVHEKRKDFEKIVPKIISGGGTLIGPAIVKALDLLRPALGSKNIILISDGQTQEKKAALQAANLALSEGVKIYTVGIGPKTDDQTMQEIAAITGGIYYRLEESQKIKLLFGEPEEFEAEKYGLTILNPNHFITKDLEINANLFGWNQVVPKTAARNLVVTNAGDPILVVWRYGLGRVAVLTTDSGKSWSGNLYDKTNSKLILRTINWIIGEPDRKERERVEVNDFTLDGFGEVLIYSDSVPKVPDEIKINKIAPNAWSTQIKLNKTGFHKILNRKFAVNYASEYIKLGWNPALQTYANLSGGKIFTQDQIDEILKEAKSKATRRVVEREEIKTPFLIALIFLFLLEIFIRKLFFRF